MKVLRFPPVRGERKAPHLRKMTQSANTRPTVPLDDRLRPAPRADPVRAARDRSLKRAPRPALRSPRRRPDAALLPQARPRPRLAFLPPAKLILQRSPQAPHIRCFPRRPHGVWCFAVLERNPASWPRYIPQRPRRRSGSASPAVDGSTSSSCAVFRTPTSWGL